MQSASLVQPRNGSRLHVVSTGPSGQIPSFGLFGSPGFGSQTPAPIQELRAVGVPGRLQMLLAHWLLLVQTVPALAPPMQRRAPQGAPPGQSAFVLHASTAAVAQVLQKQFPAVAVQGRSVARVVVPVVA